MPRQFLVWILIIGLLISTSVLFSTEEDPSAADKDIARGFYKLAREQFKKKDYAAALKELEKALKHYPGLIEALYQLGETQEKLDNESEALKAYRLCQEQIKLHQEATDEFEDTIRKLEQKIKKLGQYPNKLAQSQQQFITELLLLGQKAVTADDYGLVNEIASLVLMLEPEHNQVFDYLDDIQASWEAKLAEPKQELTGLYHKSGRENFNNRDYKKARDNFKKALAHTRQPQNIHFDLAKTYDKLNDKDPAVKYYRLFLKYLNANPGVAADQLDTLKYVQRALKRLDKLGKELDKIKVTYIKDLLKIGNNCSRNKYRYFAAQAFVRIMSLDPDHSRANKEFMKCEVNIPVPQPKAVFKPGTKILFNGKDMRYWRTLPDYAPEAWTVEDRYLMADPPEINQPAILVYKNWPPESYTFETKFIVEKKKSSDVDDPSRIAFTLVCEDPQKFPTFENYLKDDFSGRYFMTHPTERLPLMVNYKIKKTKRHIHTFLHVYVVGDRENTEIKEDYESDLSHPKRNRKGIIALTVINLKVKFYSFTLIEKPSPTAEKD